MDRFFSKLNILINCSKSNFMSLYSYYVCILRSSRVIISFPPGPFPGELLKNILSLYAFTKLVRILYLSLPSYSMLMSLASPI